MMQSGGEGGGGAAPLPPSTSGPNATDRVKEQVENVTARATEAVQGAFTHPWLPVVFRGWVCLFSFLAWTITASCGSIGTDPVNFQLAAALCTWFFSLFWLLVEVFQVLDKPLCFPPGSKIVLSFEIYSDAAMAFLCFGAACSVAGLTSTTCTNSIWGSLANAECNKLLASNVFMWFTWLVQIIPLIIFTGPAIAKATESDEGTVLRSALGTRS